MAWEKSSHHKTHEVLNQPSPLENYNLFTSDLVLQEAVARENASWAESELVEFGQVIGSKELIHAGFLANEHTPVLHNFSHFGHRIDQVEFHPAWDTVMRTSIKYRLHNLPWREKRLGGHAARAALFFISSQNEAGHVCPISMTYACLPVLQKNQDATQLWIDKVLSNEYDPTSQYIEDKKGALIGMAMTEKQGGSDVRANTTKAVPATNQEGQGAEYLLTGHKWFCSAPMSDGFLVLAQAPKGLSCFFLPRYLPDGSRNNIFVQRLKNKLGNRSNASSEIELDRACAVMMGEEGRGVPTIIEMVNHTRLDCSIGSAAMLRQSLVQAIHHCQSRSTFGKTLMDHPLMQNVLADLAVESEAATILFMRLARAYDSDDDSEKDFRRLATAISKYWICKRAPSFVYEALECLGGNGYVETGILPRIFRESPLNSIWEGSGNIICLDVLRCIHKEPQTLPAVLREIERGRGKNADFDRHVDELIRDIKAQKISEGTARVFVDRLVLALQASLLCQYSGEEVVSVFCKSRLRGGCSHNFGALEEEESVLKGIVGRVCSF